MEGTGTVVVIGLADDADKKGKEVERVARGVARGFRRRGYRVVTRLGTTHLSKSISKAAKTGAAVVVIGEDEVTGGFATIKFVRTDCEEEPVAVGLSDIFETVCRRVASKGNTYVIGNLLSCYERIHGNEKIAQREAKFVATLRTSRKIIRATCRLAPLYLKGRGVPCDIESD